MAHRILEIPKTIRLSGDLTPQDKADSDYRLIPFSVPDGVGRLHVQLDYAARVLPSQQPPADNVLDIGIFDPRGSTFPKGRGFRGWSGRERSAFQFAEFDATPGYLPGPIDAGEWAILLGLCKIAPAGCRYDISIIMEMWAELLKLDDRIDLSRSPRVAMTNPIYVAAGAEHKGSAGRASGSTGSPST